MRSFFRYIILAITTVTAIFVQMMINQSHAADHELDGQIAVSIHPIHSIVANIVEGVTEPKLILIQAQSAHHAALKPSQAKIISGSKVLIWMGMELESFLEKPIRIVAPEARAIRLLDAPGLDLRMRSNGMTDPHIWLSIDNMGVIAHYIVEQLSDIYPIHEQAFRTNLENLKQKLDELSVKVGKILKQQNGSRYLIYHDALKYLEKRYQFEAKAITTSDEELTPSAKRLIEIGRLARSGDYQCLFIEPHTNAAAVINIAKEAGLPVQKLDPAGTNLAPGPDLYFELMTHIARSIATCR